MFCSGSAAAASASANAFCAVTFFCCCNCSSILHARRRYSGQGNAPKLWIVGSTECGKKKQRSLLEAATFAAVLRSRESMKPDALFHDPYAACTTTQDLVDTENIVSLARQYHGLSYEIRTKFIDNKVMELLENNEVRQIVMLTDGMDTRPYRLTWPSGTAMFDVSPGQVYNIARERLKAAGVRVPKDCYLRHVSAVLTNGVHLEDEGWTEKLESLGYRGDRPSIWLMQGIEGLSFEGLQHLLGYASGLAMKGSMFVGDVASNALGATSKKEAEASLTKLLLSNGFRVQTVHHEDVSKDMDGTRMTMDLGSMLSSLWSLFVAQQQKLSEQQLAFISREIELAEGAGDEEGFEDW